MTDFLFYINEFIVGFKSFIKGPYFSFYSSVFGVLVGAFISWGLSKHYYIKAGEELSELAKQLNKALIIIATK